MDPGRARYTGRSHDQGTATPTGRLPPGGPAGPMDRGGCSQIAVYIEDFKHWQEKRPHGHRQKPMRCLANALTWRYSELSHRASRVHPLLTLAALPSDWSLALLRRTRRPPARMLCTFIRTWLC